VRLQFLNFNKRTPLTQLSLGLCRCQLFLGSVSEFFVIGIQVICNNNKNAQGNLRTGYSLRLLIELPTSGGVYTSCEVHCILWDLVTERFCFFEWAALLTYIAVNAIFTSRTMKECLRLPVNDKLDDNSAGANENDIFDNEVTSDSIYLKMSTALNVLVSKDRRDCHSSFMYALRAMPVERRSGEIHVT
jgi:hypothetical protein